MDRTHIRIVDYVYLMPGQRAKRTAEDRERLARIADECKELAKKLRIKFVLVKGNVQ
jgi:replicative DNA helicase